jgi:2-phosphoglycerate kinase
MYQFKFNNNYLLFNNRFAVRSKYMTLEAKYNKYIESIENIRYIQKYNIKKAEQNNIPKIDNTNIDKSIGLLRKTIINYLLKIKTGIEKEGEIN